MVPLIMKMMDQSQSTKRWNNQSKNNKGRKGVSVWFQIKKEKVIPLHLWHKQDMNNLKGFIWLRELPGVPLFISLHSLCATLKCTSPSAVMFRSAVINAGFRVSSCHVTENRCSYGSDLGHHALLGKKSSNKAAAT